MPTPVLLVVGTWLFVLSVGFIEKKYRWLKRLNATLKWASVHRSELRIVNAIELQSTLGKQIDLNELDRISAQLQELGFCTVGNLLVRTIHDSLPTQESPPIIDPHQEIKPTSNVTLETTGAARAFVHPTYGCYATVMSTATVSRAASFSKTKITPTATTIRSVNGTYENGWGFANIDFEISPIMWLLRHPRQLAHSMRGATPDQLLKAHLAERNDIAKRGGFDWDKQPTMEKCMAMEKAANVLYANVVQTWKTLPVAFHLVTYKYKKHDWWLGELEPLLSGFPRSWE